MKAINLSDEVFHISGAPAVEGLVFRRFRGSADYPAMTAIINAANAVDGIQEVESVAEVENTYSHLSNCDPFTDMLLVEVQGETIGFSRVWWRPDGEGARLYWHEGYLLPTWRRKGIGRAMLCWNENRLSEIAADHARHSDAAHADTPQYLQVFTQDTAVGKNALLVQAGYQPLRYFYFMQRAGLDNLPQAPFPPGIELRPVRPDHLRAVWDAKADAFQDHWGFVKGSEADYQRWSNDPTHDLSLWVVAWAGDQVVGTSLNAIYPEDNARYNFKRGVINSVGVLRPYRGRGLGRALIIESLRVLSERGMTEAVLGVDSDSLTGALRLYEGVGFRTIAVDWVARKPVNRHRPVLPKP